MGFRMGFLLLFLGLNLSTLRAQPTAQTQVFYLSGTGADQTVQWDFLCSAGSNSGSWSKIAVPSCWEQQGFGSYDYGHVPLNKRLNEKGTYRYQFTVPAAWKDLETQIVFEGVMTDAQVFINGIEAGPVHQGAFYEFRHQISALLKYGRTNELKVIVKKQSDNASVNEAERTADFWMFGGIFRPVYLEAKPRLNIKRVAVDARANGQFLADVHLSGQAPAQSVRVRLQALSSKAGSKETVFTTAVTGAVTRLQGKLMDVMTWSPEFPNRYLADFELLNNKGQIVHRFQQTIGFRTVEVREADGIYINGTRVKLKGVNRHTFNPVYGRTSSKALSIRDVNTIKDMNMNAVRMSHYPPEKHFLDVCDSLGLFVLDELTGWQKPAYDDTIGLKLLKEMIIRDVNHPSIIFWDNGNEGGGNYNLDNAFAQMDIQQREVLHPWAEFGKINTAHYINYDYLSHDNHSRRKLFLPTEFMHGLYDGGAGAGLEDYWQKMWADPLCAGGFIWVYADEALERRDRHDSLDTDGNHAPDGIMGPYLEKEGSYYTVREIWAPVFFEQKYITPEFDGQFHVENRFFYTDFEQCRFEVNWKRFSLPGQNLNIQQGPSQQLQCSLRPGQKGILKVDLPAAWKDYDALEITAYDPFGRQIHTWSWPVQSAAKKAVAILSRRPCSNLELKEEDGSFLVNACSLNLRFDKETGLLTQVVRGDVTVPLTNGPVLIARKAKVKQVQANMIGDTARIAVRYDDNETCFEWSVTPDGLVHLRVAYKPENNNLFAGITFDYPEQQVAGMRWLGDGPYRVYKNRMKGVSFGLWEKDYNNTVTGASGYVFPEFKGYHANTYWAELQGRGQNGFTVYLSSDDVFLRMLTPQAPAQPAKAAIVYPPGDISFLQGINSIGTKFDSLQGPQAARGQFYPVKLYGSVLNLRLIFDFNQDGIKR